MKTTVKRVRIEYARGSNAEKTMTKNPPPDKTNPDGKGRSPEKALDDFRRAPDDLSSPAWHEEVLRERGKRAAAGESEFYDWDDAKDAIMESVRKNRAKVPKDANIYFEVGKERPTEVAYDPFGPFNMVWVVTNGKIRRNFIWVRFIKTGIYVANGAPGGLHTSYHTDGKFHWKLRDQKQHLHQTDFEDRPPLPDIPKPVRIQNGTTLIEDEVLGQFRLTEFKDEKADRVVYLDNRMLPPAINYEIWAVPPFRHAEVPILTTWPAQIHIVSHTNPWLMVIIYEQGERQAD